MENNENITLTKKEFEFLIDCADVSFQPYNYMLPVFKKDLDVILSKHDKRSYLYGVEIVK